VNPNVRLRSNVYIRRDPDLRNDPAFRNQVRGREAIISMLRKIGGHENDFGSLRLLTSAQRIELFTELHCAECGAVCEGLVRNEKGAIVYTFRCPLDKCSANPFAVRQVDFNRDLAQKCVSVFGPDFDATVRMALDKPIPNPIIPVNCKNIAPCCHVKLSRNQAKIFGALTLPQLSAIVNTALIHLLREKQ
jgi:hypothetical protein